MHDSRLLRSDNTHTRLRRSDIARKIHPLLYVGCSWLVDLLCSQHTLLPAAIEGILPLPWNSKCWGHAWEPLTHAELSCSKKSVHVPHTEGKELYCIVLSCSEHFECNVIFELARASCIEYRVFLGTQGRHQAVLEFFYLWSLQSLPSDHNASSFVCTKSLLSL